MKIYAAIGHFKDNENIQSIVMKQNTKADFMRDCYGNAFVPFVVLTEAMIEKIINKDCSSLEIYEQVKKMTSNYRVWNIVTDYIYGAGYLITDVVTEIKNSEQA